MFAHCGADIFTHLKFKPLNSLLRKAVFVLFGFGLKEGSEARGHICPVQCGVSMRKLSLCIRSCCNPMDPKWVADCGLFGECPLLVSEIAGRRGREVLRRKRASHLVFLAPPRRERLGISLSCFIHWLIRGEGKECREEGLESQIRLMVSNFFSCKILFEILNLFLLKHAVLQPRFSTAVKHTQQPHWVVSEEEGNEVGERRLVLKIT